MYINSINMLKDMNFQSWKCPDDVKSFTYDYSYNSFDPSSPTFSNQQNVYKGMVSKFPSFKIYADIFDLNFYVKWWILILTLVRSWRWNDRTLIQRIQYLYFCLWTDGSGKIVHDDGIPERSRSHPEAL